MRLGWKLIASGIWALAPEDGRTSWSWTPNEGGPLALIFPSACLGTWQSEIVGHEGHATSESFKDLLTSIETFFAREHTFAPFGDGATDAPAPTVPDRATCIEHVRSLYAKSQDIHSTLLLSLSVRYAKVLRLHSLDPAGDDHCGAAASLLRAARIPVPAGQRAWSAALVRKTLAGVPLAGFGPTLRAIPEALKRGARDPFLAAAEQLERDMERPPPGNLPFWTAHHLADVYAASLLSRLRPTGDIRNAERPTQPASRDSVVAEIVSLYDITENTKWCARFAIGQAAQRGARNVYSTAAQDLNKAGVPPPPGSTTRYWTGHDVLNNSAISTIFAGLPHPRTIESRTSAIEAINTLYELTGATASCLKFAVEAACARSVRNINTAAAQDLNAAGVPPPPYAARTYWTGSDVFTARTLPAPLQEETKHVD